MSAQGPTGRSVVATLPTSTLSPLYSCALSWSVAFRSFSAVNLTIKYAKVIKIFQLTGLYIDVK